MKKLQILEKYTTGLIKGYANLLVCVAPAGSGKSENTINTLVKKNGLQENINFLYVSNYITPVELYKILQKTNKLEQPKILILDDLEDTLTNKKAVGLLKNALWEINGRRKVFWTSSTYQIKEKSFNFEGKIILLLNDYNEKSPLLNSLKDRGLFYKMELTKEEVFALIKQRAEIPYHTIPTSKRKEIANYIEKVGKETDNNISLRIFPKVCNLYLLSPHHWQDLAEKIIK